MLHTRFQGHQIYGHGGHLGHVTRTVSTNFRSRSHGGSIRILASISPGVSEEKMFKECGRQTDDRGVPFL